MDLSSHMRKVAEGDKKSFRFIAEVLGYKMHSTAIKLLGSSHFDDADDVVDDDVAWWMLHGGVVVGWKDGMMEGMKE